MARLFSDESSQYLMYSGAILSSWPLTYSLWYYQDENTNCKAISISDYDAVGSYYTTLSLRPDSASLGNSVVIRHDNASGAKAAYATTPITLNTVQHACGTIDGSGNLSAYLNGGNKGYNNYDGPAGAVSGTYDRTLIGALYTSSTLSSYMSGRLAEVGVWNLALTDAEVAMLATGISPPAVRPQSLIAYWSVIGNLSPEPDWLENKYSMALYNGPTKAAHPPVMYPVSPYLIHAPTAAADIIGPFPTFFRV